MLRRLIDKLRSIFFPTPRRQRSTPEDVFDPIDVDEAKDRFQLSEAAHRYGEQNLPASEDKTPDNPQRRIRQLIEDEIAEAFRRANHKLTNLEDAIRARSIQSLVSEVEELPSRVQERANERVDRAEDKLEQLTAQRSREKSRIKKYQQQYNIDRDPRPRESHTRSRLIYYTIGIAALQALGNAFLFGQGMRFGLSAGLILAFFLGLFDVVMHSVTGFQVARLKAKDTWNRTLGTLVALFVMFSVPAWNFGLVHLRNSIRQRGFDRGIEVWLDSLVGSPFGFSDFYSFALLILGLFCSIFAFATGWTWDEPIPTFRESGTRLEELGEDIRHWEAEKKRATVEAVRWGQNRLETLLEDIDENVRVSRSMLERIKTIRDNLFAFAENNEHVYKTLIQFYRDENRMAREDPAPSYFNEEPTITIHNPLELDVSEIEDLVARREREREELEAKLEEIREEIRTIHPTNS